MQSAVWEACLIGLHALYSYTGKAAGCSLVPYAATCHQHSSELCGSNCEGRRTLQVLHSILSSMLVAAMLQNAGVTQCT